ncbi:MAG: DUF5916 domain-containing protein, partial [Thermoanaerobaculia bacterium]|nr:DUF5916 domain-containing protein [Thermoanaerobaculia bacterium]
MDNAQRAANPLIALLLSLVTLCPAAAQDREPPTEPEIPEIRTPIRIDGLLEEKAWDEALVRSLEYETRPGENVEAPVETEVHLAHDQDHLYVAFRALDPEPERIRARLTDRDNAWQDDFVGVVLDTFNDERRAFEFFANPHGAQMDLFQDDVNQKEDASWDAIWEAAGEITDFGYVVEMAIPFRSLSFPRSSGSLVWGIDALRFYPRKDRVRISIAPLDRDLNCYLCQLEKFRGFEGITPGRNIEMVPSLTAGRTDQRRDFPGGSLEEGDLDSELGLTASWGITPNLTLAGTVNPDFSQVEADAGQLGINQQFALFFPEKRPFFLEGADFFDTPFDAVFTRTVADPAWGLKATGKEGRNGVGVFVAEDEITNLIFPGNQGSSGTSLDLETQDTVIRYRRDLGSSSALGGLFTNREGGDYHNRVTGLDGLYRFTDTDELILQLLTSETRYPASVTEAFDQPEGTLEDDAYTLQYRHEARSWFWKLGYEDLGDDFRADMGFMPRVGYRTAVGGLERIWHGESGDWYNRIRFGGDIDRTEDQQGRLLEEEYEL